MEYINPMNGRSLIDFEDKQSYENMKKLHEMYFDDKNKPLDHTIKSARSGQLSHFNMENQSFL